MNQENFADIKDRIIYVLESAEAEDVNARPHEVFLDMMKTFRVYKYDGENDFNITWADLEKWGVGLEVIAEAAKRNTPVLTPPMIYQVAATPSGIQNIEVGDSIDAALENMANIDEVKYPMYMLTNTAIYYGAGSVLSNSVYLYDWVHKAIVIGYSPDK